MKICLLGKKDSLYTKIVAKHFDELGIQYILVLESNKKTSAVKIAYISNLINMLSSKRFKYLSKIDFFTYKLLLDSVLYLKSKRHKLLIKDFSSYNLLNKNVIYTNSLNKDKELHSYLKQENIDVAIFAGVGIVKKNVINLFNKFCLNAHPAPLPACKGGGALENTLFKGLKPSVSVHIATEKIDDGDILIIKELELETNDNFNYIYQRLIILCGKALSEVVFDIINGREISIKKNVGGTLYYWKNCTKRVRKKGLKNLKKMLYENNHTK